MSKKTIAAISTPLGEGGIGVIRISGEEAILIADKIFKSVSGKTLCSLAGYSALLGHVYDGENMLDEAVATVFLAPKSYTGENVCEISCHGGRYVLNAVLRTVLKNGAVMAAPGEFTKRAFLNGKLDLVEAESVMGLISAKGEEELKLQLAAKNGRTRAETDKIEALLLELSSNFAAYSDYPDEDLPELSQENFVRLCKEISTQLKKLIETYDSGRVLREGVSTAIIGKPNVGKSTLMNFLSGEARSIVTEVAGTTRDVIENTVKCGEIVLSLADTAGIRRTDDCVESVGVTLAKERLLSAQLVLAVFDASCPLEKDDLEIIALLKRENTVVVLNKDDKGSVLKETDFEGFKVVSISAKECYGKQALEAAVLEITGAARLDPDSAILLSERQLDTVTKAYDAVCEAEKLILSGYTIDAVGVCIDEALNQLYTLDGRRATNEVADEVFRRFCVGK